MRVFLWGSVGKTGKDSLKWINKAKDLSNDAQSNYKRQIPNRVRGAVIDSEGISIKVLPITLL